MTAVGGLVAAIGVMARHIVATAKEREEAWQNHLKQQQCREDAIHEQCRDERDAAAAEHRATREEFTQVLIRLAEVPEEN